MKNLSFACLLALLGVVYCQSPVLIDLYYESYCPYSRDFISNQLWPTFKLVPEIMSVRAYPYGNAEQTFDGTSWVFTCQHGEPECIGNLIQTCALEIYPDQATWIPYLGCTEMPSNVTEPNIAASQCAIDQQLDWQLINTCTGSKEGNNLQHNVGVETESLVPTQDYVPWIIFNNVHDTFLESWATTDLLGCVCSLYSGTKPANCAAATGRPSMTSFGKTQHTANNN